jgi:hypothetical protein
MRKVEQADGAAHRIVLCGSIAEMHGQEPTIPLGPCGALAIVQVEQRRLLRHDAKI